MRILIVSVFFPPLNSIASLRPYSWAKYWTLAGHEVTVLTPTIEIPSSIELKMENPGFRVIEVPLPSVLRLLKKGYHSSGKETNKSQGHRFGRALKSAFVRFYEYLRFRRGIFNACRMPDFMDLWILPAIKAISGEIFDLVVSTSGPYSVHFVARALKKRGKVKTWVADLRDPWSDNHIYKGIFPFNLIESRVENWVLADADALTTVSEVLAKSLEIRHRLKEIHVIENGFDSEDFCKIPSKPIFPADGKYRIVHTGTLYAGKQDPEPLFGALSKLSADPGTQYLLEKVEVIFVGPNLEALRGQVDKYRLGSVVKFEGFVKREIALAMQRDAHALLFLPWIELGNLGSGVLTGKIFEYLFSGTLILAVGGRGLEVSQKLILDLNAGEIFPSSCAILSFLTKELKFPHKRQTAIAPEQLERFERRAQSMKFLEISYGLMNRNASGKR